MIFPTIPTAATLKAPENLSVVFLARLRPAKADFRHNVHNCTEFDDEDKVRINTHEANLMEFNDDNIRINTRQRQIYGCIKGKLT